MTRRLLLATLLLSAWPLAQAQEGLPAQPLVVIGHANVGRLDALTLLRLYTGRAIEASGTVVTVVNLPSGHPLRERFLNQVLNQDNEKYVAYWTVRRHIGKGAPPRELRNTGEVIEFVQTTPGAIGYIPVAEWRQGLNVVYRP